MGALQARGVSVIRNGWSYQEEEVCWTHHGFSWRGNTTGKATAIQANLQSGKKWFLRQVGFAIKSCRNNEWPTACLMWPEKETALAVEIREKGRKNGAAEHWILFFFFLISNYLLEIMVKDYLDDKLLINSEVPNGKGKQQEYLQCQRCKWSLTYFRETDLGLG